VHKFPSRGEVLLAGPGFAMVRVFVVKPEIDDGNDSSLSVFCGGNDDALFVAKERSGGRLHGDSAGVLHIERVRMGKDGAGPAGGDESGAEARIDDVMLEHVVEVDSEFIGDEVEVLEVGVGWVVLHEDEGAALPDP